MVPCAAAPVASSVVPSATASAVLRTRDDMRNSLQSEVQVVVNSFPKPDPVDGDLVPRLVTPSKLRIGDRPGADKLRRGGISGALRCLHFGRYAIFFCSLGMMSLAMASTCSGSYL